MMDCLSAQRIISEALDHAQQPEGVLAEAKQHCRDCPECAAFVRTLLVVSRSPLPEPPDDFAERLMERVGREAPAATPAAEPGAVSVDPARAPQPTLALDDIEVATALRSQRDAAEGRPTDARVVLRRLWSPEHRRATAAWASAAAITLIVAGWGAVVGVHQMLVPEPSVQYSFEGAAESGVRQDYGSGGGAQDSTKGMLLTTETAMAQPKLIVVDDIAYRFVGTAADETDESSLQAAGTVATSLDTGRSPRSYTVYQAAAPERVFLDVGAELYEFERVWLTYEGAMYLLKSGPIPAFGQWPTWPQAIVKPRTETGAPSLREAGTAEGARVFVPRTSSPRGVALPPQSPAPQAIAGCPDWTWWEPVGP